MDKFQPRVIIAYEYLHDKIVSGEFKMNTIYSSTKIAQEIGISRTPVRDALHRLSQDGYIEILPSMGFRIRTLSTSDIIEIIQIRCAIESYCAVTLSRDTKNNSVSTSNMVDKLFSYIHQMENISLVNSNIKQFIKLDNQFHTGIVSYVKNPLFDDIYKKYLFQMERFLFEVMNKPMRMQDTLKEHRTIYHKIVDGNILGIYEAIHLHLQNAATLLLQDISTDKS